VTGANTFTGSTVISSGTLILGNSLALQDSTLNYSSGTLSSGTLTAVILAGLTGSQNLSLNNASSAAVALTLGNNNVTSGYSGGMTGGGSLTKAGSGTVTLSGSNTYTGTTTASAGSLTLTGVLGNTGSYTGEINANGGTLNLNGATVYATGLENTTSAAGYVNMTGNSSVTISGNLSVNAGNTDLGNLVALTSGTLTANSATIGRGGDNEGGAILTAPTADASNGLYVNGATLNIATTLNIGNTSLSTSEMRIDSGSVTTGSTVSIFENNNRLSLLDINGGTFTCNDGGAGIDLTVGSAQTYSFDELLVRGTGVLNTRAITLGNANQTTGEDVFEDIGGTTYLGAGGIVELGSGPALLVNFGSNAVSTAPTIAASANWSSSVPITLGTSSLGVAPTIQAANSVGTAENITLTGGIGATGTSGFIKTGAGTLTLGGAGNYYNGMTTVNAGTLNINSEYALGGANYGGLTLNGGTLQYASTLLNNTTDVTVLGGMSIGASGGTIDTNGNTISFGNAFSSVTGPVTIADSSGTGSLTFHAANTYSTNTNVNSGAKLILASGASLGNTAVTVNGTFVALAGNGGVGNATMTLNGGSTLSLVDSSISSLALGGGLSIGGASSPANIDFDLSGTTADSISATNLLTYGADGGVFNFSVLAGSSAPAGGTQYTLISDTGGVGTPIFSLGRSIINIGGQNYSLSLSNTTDAEILTVNLASINYYFTGMGPGLTTSGSSSWSNITNFATDHTGATPQGGSLNSYSNVFLTADTASNYTTETLDGNYSINSLSFTGTDSSVGNTPAATSSITLASGTATAPLTLNPATGFSDANGNIYGVGTGLVVQLGSAAHTISANIALGMSQTWEIDNSSANYLTVSGVISDGSTLDTLTKTGAGTLVLSNNNTYDGGTRVTGGTVALGITNALLTTSTLTVGGSGTFDLAGYNQQVGGLSDSGTSTGTITASTGASTLTIANNAANSFSGTITDNNPGNNGSSPSLAIVMLGSTSLTLSGSNNFTGGTTVTSGTLVAASDYALGNAASQNGNAGLTLNPSASATVDFTSANPTIANLNSSGAGTSLIYLGTTAGSGSATTLNVGGADGIGYFSGTIADLSGSKSTAIGNLNVYGGGYLELQSANTFTGTTTITGAGSELILTSAGGLALQDSTLNYNNQGGTLEFLNPLTAATFGGLTGSQGLPLSNSGGAAVALTLGNNNVSSTYTGDLSGNGSLTKNGSGTVQIGSGTSGGATYTGATTVNVGTLILGGTSYLTGQVNMTGNGGSNALTVQDDAVINSTAELYLQSLNGNNYPGGSALTVTGTASVTVAGISIGNDSKVSTDSITLSGLASLIDNGSLNLISSQGGVTVGAISLNLNGGTLAVQKFIEAGIGTHSETINFNGGTLEALASDPNGSTFLPVFSTLTADVDSGGAIVNTNGFNDTIAQALVHGSGSPDGGLTKNGSGTLTLSASDNYTGPTSVSAGTLLVSGSLTGTASVSVASGGTLKLAANNAISSSAHVTLSNGTLQTLASQTETLADLTVGAGSSTLTLGSTGSIINFADSSADTWTGTLAITNWNGLSAGGGSDQVFFGSTNDLTAGQLADITFFSGTVNGTGFSTDSAVQLADGEIVAAAVPEPGTWAMFAAGVGMLGIWQRSRRSARRNPRAE
jgi:autotransporter-associated beta strand protein